MPQRCLDLASPFVDPGEVVVRVLVSAVERDGAAVRIGSIVDASEVFERDAEIEQSGLVIRLQFECGAIVRARRHDRDPRRGCARTYPVHPRSTSSRARTRARTTPPLTFPRNDCAH